MTEKPKKKRILITSPRAPVALEWAKIAQKSGYEITFVDSLDDPISRFYSNCHYVKISAPRENFNKYREYLIRLILEADIIIPTCEDIFYVAKVRDSIDFDQHKEFLMPESKLLYKLHHKFEFFKLLNSHVKIPETKLITAVKDIEYGEKTILKPVYSRFGRDVIRDVSLKNTCNLQISVKSPWVQQKFIEGQAYCNFAVCDHGKVISHSIYRPQYVLNGSAATYFEDQEHPQIQAFIETFAKEHQYHGQIAFDFIENEQGVFILECNPRATSGLHLVAANLKFNEHNDLIREDQTREKQAFRVGGTLLLLFGFQTLLSGHILKLIKDFLRAKNVLSGLPFYAGFLSFYELLKISKREKIALSEASTFDFEYNGEVDD